MITNRLAATARKVRGRKLSVGVENLESRVALSAAGTGAALGSISGRIAVEDGSRGLGGIVVQLLDSEGDVVRRGRTGPRGNYAIPVRWDGAYVVRAIAPRGWVQTSPRFTTSAPTGSMAIDPATRQPYNSSSWNYRTGNNDPANGPVGPAAWSRIAPAGARPFQSPIDIKGAPTDLSRFLTVQYAAATPTQVDNNGGEIKLQFSASSGAGIELDGTSYRLSQFHFHDPSENHVDGRAFPMEAHFVNTSDSGAATVVAVFLELGEHNEALQPILDAATNDLTEPGSSTTTGPIDLAGLLPSGREGWFFQGSLTTPPLAQALNWFVLSTPITLDFQQLKQYEAVADAAGFLPNARPIQPTNGRVVNEFNVNIDYKGTSIPRVDFTFARVASAGVA